MTRRLFVGALALGAVLFFLAPPAQAKSSLLGKWRVVKMSRGGKSKVVPKDRSATLEFKKGGVFVTSVSFRGKQRSDTGTWATAGDKLTTQMRKRKETLNFKISGGELVLTHPVHKGKMHLKRVK